jgi:hypothetical protein
LPDAFDPPTYRQVAQRNLTVTTMGGDTMAMTLALTVGALPREDKDVVVTVEAERAASKELLTALGLTHLKPARKGAVEAGITEVRSCPGEDGPLGEKKVRLKVARGTSTGVFISVRARGLRTGEYQLLHVAERRGDQLLGGLGLVVVGPEKGENEKGGKAS